jgi:ATP-dependent Clp protease protease subunit
MKLPQFNNATDRKFVAAKQANILTIYAYDAIGAGLFDDGVTAKGIASALDDAGQIDSIVLRINSPGGNLFEALAIKSLLDAKDVPIAVYIDGEAASAATILMLAGDTITMGEGSMLMVHNAMTMAFGNAAELRKTADDLEKVSGEMRKLYATRTGLPEDQLQAMMNAETFLTADEAVAQKFADGIAKKAVVTAVKAIESNPVLSREQFDYELFVAPQV